MHETVNQEGCILEDMLEGSNVKNNWVSMEGDDDSATATYIV